MILEEDYCSYEIAKLLKEKGFDVKPYHQYYVSRCGKVFGCKGNEMKQTITNRGYKRITLSINGKEMNRFSSVKEAGLFIGKPHAEVNISACALGKRHSAYGYHWEYAIEVTKDNNPFKD